MGTLRSRCCSWLVALVGILIFGLVLPLLPVAPVSAAATLPEAMAAAVDAGGVQAPAGISVSAAGEQKH